jgi:hypothetical protein
VAAGCVFVFRDEVGGVLLVNPVYKRVWDLPGGAVDAEESRMWRAAGRWPRNWA